MKSAATYFLIAVLLLIIAAICNSAMDTLQFRFSQSVFSKLEKQSYWNPNISWRNKWKDGEKAKGEKFFGSSTFLVFTTDAWHLFKSGWITCMMAIAVMMGHAYLQASKIKQFSGKRLLIISITIFILFHMLHGAIFELFFTHIWI